MNRIKRLIKRSAKIIKRKLKFAKTEEEKVKLASILLDLKRLQIKINKENS